MLWSWKGPFLRGFQVRNCLLGGLFGLLGQKNSLDVGKNSALSDCNSRQQFVQFLVVTDSQLKMTRDDSRFLVVSGSISSQFQDFSRQVLQDSGQIDWCSASNSWRESSLSQESVNSTDWELKSSSEWSGLGLRLSFSSFSTSRHDSDWCVYSTE